MNPNRLVLVTATSFGDGEDHGVRSFGIGALLVKPDFTGTGIGESSQIAGLASEPYAAPRRHVIKIAGQNISNGASSRDIAEIGLKAASAPDLRDSVGYRNALSIQCRFVPARLSDQRLHKRFRTEPTP